MCVSSGSAALISGGSAYIGPALMVIGVFVFSNLRFSSSTTDVELVYWSLPRRLLDYQLQQGLRGSDEGGAMAAVQCL